MAKPFNIRGIFRARLRTLLASADSGAELPKAGAVEAQPAAPQDSAPIDLPAGQETGAAIVAPPAAAGSWLKLKGHIDECSRSRLVGWVWDPERPGERVEVEVASGETVLLTFVAGLYRNGLEERGVGDGHHAFKVDIPPGTIGPQIEKLSLRCATTGKHLPGSPKPLSEPPKPADEGLRWHVDRITAGSVIGWVFAANDPNRRCTVCLLDGTRVISRAQASKLRPGLKEAGIGDGAYEFNLPLPASLRDGEEHLLDVKEESSGRSLLPQPKPWRFETIFSKAAHEPCTAYAVISLYELLYGRGPENSFVIELAKQSSIRQLMTSIFTSPEFIKHVEERVKRGDAVRHEVTLPRPNPRDCAWIASMLRLRAGDGERLLEAASWQGFLRSLLPYAELIRKEEI